MKITVFGLGYVGLSNSILLAQKHSVTAVDVVEEKVAMVNRRQSPIVDPEITHYLNNVPLQLKATTDWEDASKNAELVIVATPTNYDPQKNFFDTSAVEAVIKLVIQYNPDAVMVIKSTIPVGFTASVREKYHCDNILFSPEFLRESKALYDNLYPSRIIVGTDISNKRLLNAAHEFVFLLKEGAIKKDIELKAVPSEGPLRPFSWFPVHCRSSRRASNAFESDEIKIHPPLAVFPVLPLKGNITGFPVFCQEKAGCTFGKFSGIENFRPDYKCSGFGNIQIVSHFITENIHFPALPGSCCFP